MNVIVNIVCILLNNIKLDFIFVYNIISDIYIH